MLLNQELQTLILLSFLFNSWKILMVSLINSTSNGIVTLVMIKDSILNKELRRKELGITSEFSAIVTKN
jgi:hypothetical protein